MKAFAKGFSAFVLALMSPVETIAQSESPGIACGETYIVASGDTLSRISLRAYGQSGFSSLHQSNIEVIGSNPDRIYAGQRLEIPCRSADATPAVSPEVPTAEQPAAPEVELESDAEPTDPGSDTGNIVLTFNKTSAPKFVMNSGIIDIFLAEITEVTEGRVRFIDPPVVNRDPMVQLDLVTSGVMDGAYVFNGYLGESHPLLQLPMLPLMGGSAEQTAVSLWRLHDEYLSETDYFNEAKLLGFVAAPAAHIWRLANAPASANEDIVNKNSYVVPYFEGLDTRGPDVVRQETETRLALYDEQANEPLAFFMAHGAARAAGIWNNDRTVTEVDNGLYTPTFSVILSNEAWASISAQDRDAILAVSGERLATRSASWDEFDNGHRRHMIDTGLNTVKADPALMAELRETSRTGIKTWIDQANATGVRGFEAVNAYKEDLNSLQDRLLFQ